MIFFFFSISDFSSPFLYLRISFCDAHGMMWSVGLFHFIGLDLHSLFLYDVLFSNREDVCLFGLAFLVQERYNHNNTDTQETVSALGDSIQSTYI